MKRLVIKRKAQTGILAFVLVVIFAACSKEKEENLLLENTWLMWELKRNADDFPEAVYVASPTITFIGKDKYVFQADGYCAVARVKIEKNNKIQFETPMRDYPNSPSARSCIYLLNNEISHYDIDDNGLSLKLILTGDNGAIINLIQKQF